MNPNSKSFAPDKSTESINTEWDDIAVSDNIEQKTNTSELEENATDEKNNAEHASEDWLTIRGLAKEFGLSDSTISRAINQDPPIDGKEYKAKNGILVKHYLLSEVAKRIERFTSAEFAPEGWLTINGLAKELGLSYGSVKNAITQNPPIEGKDYKIKNGLLITHYPLSKVAKRVEHLSSAESAPEGWLTIIGLAKELGLSDGSVKNAINQDPPIEGKGYRDKSGHLFPHYPLSEVAKRVEHLSSAESAPEGWLAQRGLAKKLGLSKSTIKKYINQDPPIEGKEYKDKAGRLTPHYPLSEVAKRVERFTSAESAPKGWLPINSLVKELGLGSTVIKNAINQDPPIEGKGYRDKSGHLFTHYPLSEVAKRVERLTSAEFAPEGWLTTLGLAKELGFSDLTIKKAIDRTPVEGKEYRSANGVIYTFYSPEEQAAILEELENSTAGTSFPETAFFFYIQQVIPGAESLKKPQWLKGLRGGQMEIDIYFEYGDPPKKIGIEYDGKVFHNEAKKPSDIHKNKVAEENNVNIIRIRENGCPELPSSILCINRQSNRNDDLAEPIKQLFATLDISLPETGIDIKRDTAAINALMRKDIVTQDLDTAKSRNELSVVA